MALKGRSRQCSQPSSCHEAESNITN